MPLLILLLILFLVFGGVGFSLHFLWIAAAVALVLLVLGFFTRGRGPWW